MILRLIKIAMGLGVLAFVFFVGALLGSSRTYIKETPTAVFGTVSKTFFSPQNIVLQVKRICEQFPQAANRDHEIDLTTAVFIYGEYRFRCANSGEVSQ